MQTVFYDKMDWISLNHLSMSPTQQNTSVVIVVLLIPPDIPLQFWSKTAFLLLFCLSIHPAIHPESVILSCVRPFFYVIVTRHTLLKSLI